MRRSNSCDALQRTNVAHYYDTLLQHAPATNFCNKLPPPHNTQHTPSPHSCNTLL